MWVSSKENSEYTAQITPYHGRVNAEIIRRNKDKWFYDHKIDLWLTVVNKSFGSMFRSTPREIDYQRATAWVEEQLSMIEKYGTVMVTTPKFLKDLEKENKK